MRLLIEGFYISDYVEDIILYIESGKFSAESVWKSKDRLVNQLNNYTMGHQIIIVTEIREFLVRRLKKAVPGYLHALLGQTSSHVEEQRAVELLKHFEPGAVNFCEEKCSYDFDLQMLMDYITNGTDLSKSYYQSKDKFFENLTHYNEERQQWIIREIKTHFEKNTISYSEYVFSFLRKRSQTPTEQRVEELLAIFDPKYLALVMTELEAENNSLSIRHCCIQ